MAALYDKEARMNLGTDRFAKVYIKTESGNIYLLDGDGRLYNANDCRERGEISAHQLDPQVLEGATLTVGQPFVYDGGRTTPIKTIVPHTDRNYATEALRELTDNRMVDIQYQFFNRLPKVPVPPEDDRDRALWDFSHERDPREVLRDLATNLGVKLNRS